eukprot:EC718603.1.p1 GENE.EC718603.1~~EC718603.1.p1  ORF type:complete len:78 (-),score=1.79 EC718603.1:88-321(-)
MARSLQRSCMQPNKKNETLYDPGSLIFILRKDDEQMNPISAARMHDGMRAGSTIVHSRSFRTGVALDNAEMADMCVF